MPTIQQNLHEWENYHWNQQGDEWSAPWGGTELLWWGSLFPRIHAFVPTDSILEIAPGFGRITTYLKDLCKNLTVVDLAEDCIETCKRRFSSCTNITYHHNDGKSLDMIPDQSIDFVFSFDSLVHAEADVLEAYLSQLVRKLKPNGIGFIHHSNVGACINPISTRIRPLEYLLRHGWRAESMTAKIFEQHCKKAGLQCIGQEIINWYTRCPLPIDCFSVFTQKNSTWARPNTVLQNMKFTRESLYLAKLSQLYSTSSFEAGCIKEPAKSPVGVGALSE